MQVYLVLALVFSIAVATFAVQNATKVDITLFFWQLKQISLVVVIFGSALLGAIAAGLFGAVKQLKAAKNLRSCKTEAESLSVEIDYLNRKLKKLEQPEKQEKQEKPDNACEGQ